MQLHQRVGLSLCPGGSRGLAGAKDWQCPVFEDGGEPILSQSASSLVTTRVHRAEWPGSHAWDSGRTHPVTLHTGDTCYLHRSLPQLRDLVLSLPIQAQRQRLLGEKHTCKYKGFKVSTKEMGLLIGTRSKDRTAWQNRNSHETIKNHFTSLVTEKVNVKMIPHYVPIKSEYILMVKLCIHRIWRNKEIQGLLIEFTLEKLKELGNRKCYKIYFLIHNLISRNLFQMWVIENRKMYTQ